MPLVFPRRSFHRDLEQSKYDSVSKAIGSLLEVLKTLVVKHIPMIALHYHVAAFPAMVQCPVRNAALLS